MQFLCFKKKTLLISKKYIDFKDLFLKYFYLFIII